MAVTKVVMFGDQMRRWAQGKTNTVGTSNHERRHGIKIHPPERRRDILQTWARIHVKEGRVGKWSKDSRGLSKTVPRG